MPRTCWQRSPSGRTYGSSLNVINNARALKTRAKYLELVSVLIPGRMSRTSVNACVGKYLTSILAMSDEYDVPKHEKDRLLSLVNEKGDDYIHVRICPFYNTVQGCRKRDECEMWHLEENMD